MENKKLQGKDIEYDYDITKKAIVFYVDEEYIDKEVDVYVNDEFLIAAKVGKKGNIKVNKQSQVGKYLVNALNSKQKVVLLV